jgi:hypothetical protein
LVILRKNTAEEVAFALTKIKKETSLLKRPYQEIFVFGFFTPNNFCGSTIDMLRKDFKFFQYHGVLVIIIDSLVNSPLRSRDSRKLTGWDVGI